MKKASILFLAILLIGSMLLTSCADAPREGDSEPSASEPTDQTENNSDDNNNTEEIQKDSTDLLIFTLQEDDTYSVTGIKDKTVAGELVIPSTYEGKPVTSIGKKAFYECRAIQSVTIPDSVTSIGTRAFVYCVRLTSVTFGNGVTSIGEEAFDCCLRLDVVVLPDSVTSIGDSAFDGCGLVSLTIGKNVTKIGDIFGDNTKLVEIINKSSCEVEDLVRYAESYYPEVLIHTGESKIVNQNGYLFYTYSNENYLLSYTGHDTVLTLPEDYNGENYKIGVCAFYRYSDLLSVTIGSGVMDIDWGAFQECIKLAEVINKSDLTITPGSKENGEVAYYAKEVHTGESKIVNQNGYWFYPYEDTNYLLGYTGTDAVLTLPENYNGNNYEINDYAFHACENITSITIPNSVTSIGEDAFYYCRNLMSVTIGSGVTEIGRYAFDACDKLVEVINKSNLTITAGAEDHGSVAENAIEVHTGTTKIDKVNDYFFYHHSNGTHYLLNYTGFETVLTLPENYNGESYEINDYAFYECINLTSVTIPDSVTAIGKEAFSYCDNLTSITIGSGVTSIGESAFARCDSLTSVTIPNSVTAIGSRAFRYCENLMSVTIGSGVTEIGGYAFESCYKLVEVINKSDLTITVGFGKGQVAHYAKEVHTGTTRIDKVNDYLFYHHSNGTNYLLGYTGSDTVLTLPEIYNGNNYEINDYAFYECTNLTSVTIPNSVTSIGDYAFYRCENITSITIPSSVTSIGEQVFYHCKNLTSVTIPDSVISIGSYTFEYCENLTSVVFANTSGWKADGTAVAGDSLADPATAATYLTDTYCRSTWQRT